MGRMFILIFGIALLQHGVFGQSTVIKPVIDTGSIGTWPYITEPLISSGGNYVAWQLNRDTSSGFSVVIKERSGIWELKFPRVKISDCYFTLEEKYFIFLSADTLCFISLKSSNAVLEKAVRTSRFIHSSGNGDWVAYESLTSGQDVTLYNSVTAQTVLLSDITNFQFDPSGRYFFYQDSLEGKLRLNCLELANGKTHKLMEAKAGESIGTLKFDVPGRQALFNTSQSAPSPISCIWYYREGMKEAKLKLCDSDGRLDSSYKLTGYSEFSRDGRWIFFSLQLRFESLVHAQINRSLAAVDIWGYRDRKLQPEQQLHPQELNRNSMAAMAVDLDKVVQIETSYRKLSTAISAITGDKVIVQENTPNDFFVTPTDQENLKLRYYSLSLLDGTLKLLLEGTRIYNLSLSPDGQWLIFFDAKKLNFYSYNFLSGAIINMTGNLKEEFWNDHNGSYFKVGDNTVCGWMENNSFLLFDNYNLWQFYPDGSRMPVNLTGHYGLNRHIKLRMMDEMEGVAHSYKSGDSLLLAGFDEYTKDNGFYRLVLGNKNSLKQLSSGPFTIFRPRSLYTSDHSFDGYGMMPIKASTANCWVIKRQSSTDFPNLFFTTDFRSFSQLTNLRPQERFKWLTSTLINYRQLDGSRGQAILYKPQDFDSSKKYPVIFNYYQELTYRLHEFPEDLSLLTGDNINIPWFVSRGYLVCTPDIHFRQANVSGKTAGAWAYNSVVGAANALCRLPYVDSKHMGLQGHSFGGEQTNYLITHSGLFVASCVNAGNSDMISTYLTLVPTNDPAIENGERLTIRETGQGRMGTTLWQRPDLYLQESAVLKADKVKAPILIVHNKNDGAVPWRQGVEFFMALRRLQKPCWMLQYDGEGHVIWHRYAVLDYTIRLTQFFDHYLKGYPPPLWMTKGVPLKQKQVITGYEKDTQGSCSPNCAICWKKNYALIKETDNFK